MCAQWIGDVILFLALIAAIWYAWETRKLRLQMIQPKLIFAYDAQRQYFCVKNVGEGVAVNVSLGPIRPEAQRVITDPSSIPFLVKNEEKGLALRRTEGTSRPDMSIILDAGEVLLEMTATYYNVAGKEFQTVTLIGGAAKLPFIRDNKK